MPITAAKLLIEVGADTKQAETGLAKVQSALDGFAKRFSGSGAGGNIFAGFLGANVAMAAGRQVQGLARDALAAYSSYELLGKSLQTLTARELLNSKAASSMGQAMQMAAPRAQGLLGWIEKLAIQSPFSQDDVAQAFRMAQAYGFTADESKRLVQSLIDFSAGTGASGAVMQQIALALGQIQAKGKLAGQEVLQLVNAGISVDRILADAFGKSTAEIVEMREKGLIPADQAIEAIVSSLERDFTGAAKGAALTASGLVESLEDIKSIGLREFFAGTFETLKPYVADFVESWNTGEIRSELRALGQQVGQTVGDIIPKIREAVDTWNLLEDSNKKLALSFAGVVLFSPQIAKLLSTIIGMGGGAITIVRGLATAWSAWQSGLTLTTALGAAGLTPIAITLGSIAAILGSVVAVWAVWNQEITKTNQEGAKAAAGVWDKFFADQVASGKSAAQIYDEYTGAVGRAQGALDSANPFVRLFIQNQDQLTGGFEALSKTMAGRTSDWAEYSSILQKAAEAQGMFIDEQGNLAKIIDSGTAAGTKEIVVQGYKMSQSQYAAAQATKGLTTAFRWQTEEGQKLVEVDQAAAEAAQQMADDIRQANTNMALDTLSKALEAAEWDTQASQAAMDKFGISMGATSAEAVQFKNDLELVSQAYAEHILSGQEMTAFMQQATEGTLALNAAQRVELQTSIEQAQALKDAAGATNALAVEQAELAQQLKGANKAQVANALIEGLRQLKDAGTLGSQDYLAALLNIQDAFKLTDAKSRAAAEGVQLLTQATQNGQLPAEKLGEILLKGLQQGGKVDWTALIAQYAPQATTAGEQIGEAVTQGAVTKWEQMEIDAQEKAKAAADAFSTGQDWTAAGTTAGEGIKTGMDEATATLGEQAGTAATNVATAFAEQEWDKTGATIIQDIGAGMEAQVKLLIGTQIKSITNAIKNAFLRQDWKGVGLAIAAGIAAGITAGKGLITGAAADAASSAVTAAQAAVQANSPAKVPAKKVGEPIAEGIAKGMADGMLKQQQAMKRTAAQAIYLGAPGNSPERAADSTASVLERMMAAVAPAQAMAPAPAIVKVYIGNEELDARIVRVVEGSI